MQQVAIHQKQPIYYLNFLTYIWCFSLSIQANCSPTHVNSVAKLDVCDELQVVNNPGTYVRVPPIDNFVSTSNGATTFHTFQPNNSRSTSDKNSSKFFLQLDKVIFFLQHYLARRHLQSPKPGVFLHLINNIKEYVNIFQCSGDYFQDIIRKTPLHKKNTSMEPIKEIGVAHAFELN